jgi:low affinity Fe/Cu permease
VEKNDDRDMCRSNDFPDSWKNWLPGHPKRTLGLEAYMKGWFHKVAQAVASAVGSPFAFLLGMLVIAAWLLSGPLFGFSDTWQLIINTGTTVITFLMVFLIQNMQNRDGKVIQLKLDELIRATQKARNSLIDLEDLSEEEIELIDKGFKEMRSKILENRLARKRPHPERSHAAQPAGDP